jgi:hypothetical protein
MNTSFRPCFRSSASDAIHAAVMRDRARSLCLHAIFRILSAQEIRIRRIVRRQTPKVFLVATVAFAGALLGSGPAAAEIVARNAADGLLALAPNGKPSVAFVRGTQTLIATRGGKDKWRSVSVGKVAAGSTVKAFKIGRNGPVALVQSGGDRSLVAIRRRGTGWQTTRIANVAGAAALGWPGLTFDANGRPVVAYTRWNGATLDTQLLIVRIGGKGKLTTQSVTREGFPQSTVPPAAAPVLVGGRIHVVQSYGLHTVVGAFEWYPDGNTWTGLGLDVSRGEFPVGPILAGLRGGRLYAAWSQSLFAFEAIPVTLAERATNASSQFVLDRALTAALALPASGAEVAANQWVAASELGLDGEAVVWEGTVVTAEDAVGLDGWVGGLAVAPKSGRDVLLERGDRLEWFRSPGKLDTFVNVRVFPGARDVTLAGTVDGVSSGRVTIYRERPGGTREVAGTAQLSGGEFSFTDSTSARPLLYRAVYTDPATSIPYATLSRPIP